MNIEVGVAKLLRVWRFIGNAIPRVLDSVAAFLTIVFSPTALVWIGLILLIAGSVCGWVRTPLQGVFRAYAYPLSGNVVIADALGNRPRLLSFALPCILGAILVVAGRFLRGLNWLPRHVGAAVLILALFFPISLISTRANVILALVQQNDERDQIRSFAGLIGGYSGGVPALGLIGTASLVQQAETAWQLLGYGWCFAVAGAGFLIGGGFVRSGPVRVRRFVLLWSGMALVILVVTAGSTTIGEYHRLRGENFYAKGRYESALGEFRKAMRWTPSQRDNVSFQYRVGATLFFLGDRTSPQAQFFVASNHSQQKEYADAEAHFRLALARDPGWRLARRRLAATNADWGISLFKVGDGGAIPRWLQARAIEGDLLRTQYFLANAYYLLDERDQTRSIAEHKRLIAVTRDRGILADLYSLLGNSYFKQHEDAQAREMFRLSLAMVPLVKQLNLQAQRGLIGL